MLQRNVIGLVPLRCSITAEKTDFRRRSAEVSAPIVGRPAAR